MSRTDALKAILAEELERRRDQLDGEAHLTAVELKIRFHDRTGELRSVHVSVQTDRPAQIPALPPKGAAPAAVV